MEEQFPSADGYIFVHYVSFKFGKGETKDPYIEIIPPADKDDKYVIGLEPSTAQVNIHLVSLNLASVILNRSEHLILISGSYHLTK